MSIRVNREGKAIVEDDYDSEYHFKYDEFEEVIGSFACGGATGPDDEAIAKHAILSLND